MVNAMTKDEAIRITASVLIDVYSRTEDTIAKASIVNAKHNALNGDKESVAWLYHNLEEFEELISELKQAMKGEQQ